MSSNDPRLKFYKQIYKRFKDLDKHLFQNRLADLLAYLYSIDDESLSSYSALPLSLSMLFYVYYPEFKDVSTQLQNKKFLRALKAIDEEKYEELYSEFFDGDINAIPAKRLSKGLRDHHIRILDLSLQLEECQFDVLKFDDFFHVIVHSDCIYRNFNIVSITLHTFLDNHLNVLDTTGCADYYFKKPHGYVYDTLCVKFKFDFRTKQEKELLRRIKEYVREQLKREEVI